MKGGGADWPPWLVPLFWLLLLPWNVKRLVRACMFTLFEALPLEGAAVVRTDPTIEECPVEPPEWFELPLEGAEVVRPDPTIEEDPAEPLEFILRGRYW